MFKFIFLICFIIIGSAQAQIFQKKEEEKKGIRLPKYVATKNTYGMIAGLERGQYTFMELGAEKHWKKIRLVHAQTIGANANLEYNFGNNILGYNAAAWIKTGRVDLTYGFSLNYITDFEKSRYGLGPQIGFRLLGLHFLNGYNFLVGNKELTEVNKFYVGLRYYFPLQSKTTIENVNKRKPSTRSKQKEGTKAQGREKLESKAQINYREEKGNSSRSTPGKNKKKKNKRNQPEIEEKSFPFNIFKKKQPEPISNKKSERKKAEPSKKNKNNSKSKKNSKEPEKKKFLDNFRKNN